MSVSPRFSCSPDGQSIPFAAYSNGTTDIWKITRDNTTPVRVVASSGMDDSPRWLYDGSGFVFRSNRTVRFTLWMCDPNGNDQKQIVPDTGNGYTSWPIPSPRLPLIAFSRSFGTMFVFDYAHGTLVQLTPDLVEPNSNFPAWSPLGDKLAFEVQHGLYVWGASKGLRSYWTDDDFIFNPSWSPDGQEIAFNAWDRLEALNLATHEVRSVASGMAYGGRCCWSPDGRMIAMETQDPPRIVVMPRNGGIGYELLMGEDAAVAPKWIKAIW